MIKLMQIVTVYGETTLLFLADGFPEGQRQVKIPLEELIQRLRLIRDVLGRPLTLQDAREALIAMVDEMREARSRITERFDFSQYVGVDLEAY